MNSIGDSSKAQLEDVIRMSGTIDSWYITKTEIIHRKTGSKFIFRGMHNNYNSLKSIPNIDIAWIEECETISKESLDILIPTIRKQNSQLWFSGNPRDRMAAVSQLFIENETPDGTIIIANDYRDNPYCSQTLVDEAKAMEASNSELYRHIWLGEYLDISNLILVKNVVRGTLPTIASDKVIVGIDIARDGGDRTVICIRKGKSIADIRVFPTMDLTNLVHELNSVIHKWNPEQINVDATGHGAWVPDALKASGIYCKSINFAESSRYPDKYANMRTEMYGLASDYFTNGGKIRPQDIELERELESSYYTLDNHNRIKLVPKTEIKQRTGKSPDIADSFSLSLITSGDMFKSSKKNDEIQQQNLGKALKTAGSW
jgi:phage terminase large subunit